MRLVNIEQAEYIKMFKEKGVDCDCESTTFSAPGMWILC